MINHCYHLVNVITLDQINLLVLHILGLFQMAAPLVQNKPKFHWEMWKGCTVGETPRQTINRLETTDNCLTEQIFGKKMFLKSVLGHNCAENRKSLETQCSNWHLHAAIITVTVTQLDKEFSNWFRGRFSKMGIKVIF